MMTRFPAALFLFLIAITLHNSGSAYGQNKEPLPTWNDVASKKSILQFVDRVTVEEAAEFVPVSDRIAVFDNDGTLWCEKPYYTQLAYAFDRAKLLVNEKPDLKSKPVFQALLADDMRKLAQQGEAGLMDLLMATHAGQTTSEFSQDVTAWLQVSKHPRFQRAYTELVYQPMLELIDYLQQKQFKVYIVSGGGVDFVRTFSADVYGIPSEQVIGSTIKTKYEERDGVSVLVRQAAIDFIDDKAGKPVRIHSILGKKPIIAIGNSDGDYEMLRYITDRASGETAARATLGVIVHHTDSQREFAYDRESAVGKLDRALTESPARGWVVVDMAQDWKEVFPQVAETKKGP